jgi:hypothetical protein
VLTVSQHPDKYVLGGQLVCVSRVQFNKPNSSSPTYVNVQDLGDKKTRKNQAVADFLHENTSRSESRRSHIRTAEVVDNDSDDDVNHGGGSLADQNGAGVKPGVLHLRCDRKVGWNSCRAKSSGQQNVSDITFALSLAPKSVRLCMPLRGQYGV